MSFSLNQPVEVNRRDGKFQGKIIGFLQGNRYIVKYDEPHPLDLPAWGSETVPANFIRAAAAAATPLPVARANTGNMASYMMAPAAADMMPRAALTYRSCDDFRFPTEFLKECERSRKWVGVTGDLSATCGYTGPGIGLIVLLFERNNISDDNTLRAFLTLPENVRIFGHLPRSKEVFKDIVNETIGNFLDLSKRTPVTETKNGVMGIIIERESIAARNMARAANPDAMDLIDDEIEKVFLVDNSNIVKGVNIISFKDRSRGSSTFHHSAIYAIPEENICFILDSWYDNYTGTCRQLTCRQFSFEEVKDALVKLNSQSCTVDDAYEIFAKYFQAANAFLNSIARDNSFYVYVLNQEYIKSVYTKCETSIINGQPKSNLGGYNRNKKNVKTKKLYKKTTVRTKKPHMRRYIRSKKHRTRRQIRAK